MDKHQVVTVNTITPAATPGKAGGCCHCSPGSRLVAAGSMGVSPPNSTLVKQSRKKSR